MRTRAYAYPLRREVILFDEEEFADYALLARGAIQKIKDYRAKTGCSLPEALEAREAYDSSAIDLYEARTGIRLEHPDNIWSVDGSRYGRLCPKCAKPFRTPQAKLCAECGYQLPAGQIAGPLAFDK